MSGALSHIRVLDLSRILAGPWSGQILADLGAEVIKVERPQVGDDTRTWGPPFLKDEEGNDTAESAYFLSANRGKKSVAIDMTTPEGQAVIRELAQHADIVLENFKVGGLKKYGLDYDSLKALNPKIIYCSITGFGQTGPYSHRPGYDFMIQGMGGLMSLTGEKDGVAGGGPQKVGVALADVLTGMYATTSVLAALAHRDHTGVGQYIDLALLDVQAACLANQGTNYLIGGQVPQRLGNAHPNIVPYQTFATEDGFIILAVGNDGQFGRFCQLIDRADLATDERFSTNKARVKNRVELIALLEPHLLTRSSETWLADLEKASIPCGPINTVDKVFENPQIQHREMQVDIPHPLSGTVPQVGSPMKFSETPITYNNAPPTLGQHTESVLSDILQLDAEAITALKDKNIIN